jgi:type II secretory pathway component PulK
VATTLPTRTAINVNTAPERVLRALAPDAKPERWADRAVRPFTSVQDFVTRVGATPDVEISVATRYFFVDAQATLGNARAGSLALVDRTQGVIWEVSQ